MPQRLLRLLAMAPAATAAMFITVPTANAETPLQQGWWTVANPSALPVPAPPPPDVPADGLLVQGGPSSPIAYAALIYDVAKHLVPGQLTLRVAAASGTVPGSTLELCALRDSTIIPEQGGPIDDAPAYNCKKKVTAKPDAKGQTYRFNVSTLAAHGLLAVAILPGDATTRVVLSHPGVASLPMHRAGTTPPPPPPPPSSPAPAPGSTSDTGSTGSATGPVPSNGGFAAGPPTGTLPSAPATQPSPVVAAPPAATPPSQNPTFVASAATPPGSSNTAEPAAVAAALGAVLLAATVWTIAGRTPDP